MLTVILYANNHAGTVVDAIKSVPEGVNLVVWDDASTDGSWKEMKWLSHDVDPEDAFSAFRLDEPVGRPAALNLAVQSSWEGSDSFFFLDGDCRLTPNAVGDCVRGGDILYGDELVDGVYRPREPFCINRLAKTNIAGDNFLVTKDVLRRVGLFKAELGGEASHEFLLRTALACTVTHVPQVFTERTGVAWAGPGG